MSSQDYAIRTIRQNRAMMHKPSMYENMKRYQKKNGATIGGFQNMTKEEQKIFDKKMKRAKRKAFVREARFLVFSTIGIGVILFLIVKNFLL